MAVILYICVLATAEEDRTIAFCGSPPHSLKGTLEPVSSTPGLRVFLQRTCRACSVTEGSKLGPYTIWLIGNGS